MGYGQGCSFTGKLDLVYFTGNYGKLPKNQILNAIIFYLKNWKMY
jgi:hypothetical protein